MPTDNPAQPPPEELLEELGLQRYEAHCFVALTRLSEATAREISEVADVPRTRVYDAVEQLEDEGLVDVQHSNPKRFRAVSVEQAVALLRERFDRRFDHLLDGLETLEHVDSQPNGPAGVWATTGQQAVDTRTIEFVDAAADEVIFVVNDGETLSDRVIDRLQVASERDVTVIVGTLTEAATERIRSVVPQAVFLDSEISWLKPPDDTPLDEEGNAVIGRIVVVDREAVLLSSLNQSNDHPAEHGLWCDDLDNGLVVIARRLLIAGLEPTDFGSQ